MKQEIIAYFVKTPLDLSAVATLKNEYTLTDQERTVIQFRFGEYGVMHVFSYGVVTFFGIEKKQREIFLQKVREVDRKEIENDQEIEPKQYTVIVDTQKIECVNFEFIRITNTKPEKIRLIAEALAQSVMFDLLERRIEKILFRFADLHAHLSKTGKLHARTKTMMKMVGDNGNIMHFIVTKLAFLVKPDVTWEEEEYEILYTRLRREFELDERFRALKFRLQFAQDSSELVLDLLSTKKSELLEITIVVLIAFEIILFLFAS